MSKRGADDAGGGGSVAATTNLGQPPIKKVHFEPHLIGPVSTLEEMDIKVLEFQNKKLAQRIEQRMRTEAELRHRIEQLEKRQMQDDAVLNVVNRYWNQLNEDIRVLLQRFDAETADESENRNENEVTTSFLTQLSTWDKEELDDKLANRVQVSKRAVAKIVQVIDRIMQRNEKITIALKEGTGVSSGSNSNANAEGEDGTDNVTNNLLPNIDETLKQTHIEIMTENRNLQSLNTSLHEKFHTISLKMKECQDALTAKETENAELKNQIDELQYDLEKVHCRNDKLENHLAEAIEKLKAYHQMHGDPNKSSSSGKTSGTANVNSQHYEDLQKELEEYRELANNRLQELDKLHATHRETLKEVEKLKMDIRQLPESVIVETTEYKCLQSQFSVLYNESMQIKTMLDETRNQLQTSKNQHLRQIEVMESEELIAQKKVRSEMIQMEDVLAQIRKEYETLRIEFEQNMAANEQTAPINREMRHLITSLQNHNGQLKGEVQRYKRKYKDASADNVKLRKEVEDTLAKLEGTKQQPPTAEEVKQESGNSVKEETATSGTGAAGAGTNESSAAVKDEPGANAKGDDGEEETKEQKEGIKQEKSSTGVAAAAGEKKEAQAANSTNSNATSGANAGGTPCTANVKVEKDAKDVPKAKEIKLMESEIVRDLKAQLKKALNDQKEMKLLLDMYKGVSKDQRDKVQLMATEKKLRSEIEELRQQLKKIQESKREERKKLADEEALRKIKQLEEQKYELQKQVASQKPVENTWGGTGGTNYARPFVGSHEEEALLNEMEVTGQAFEDMQEQNSRLIQQLREKDDANFKLMSERIKANQMHNLLREEKQILVDQMTTRDTQIEAMHIVLRKLEEKERSLQATVATIEKELMLRQQAMEMHKRKAIESAQSAADLKLHLEKYHSQMKEAQQVVAEKTSSLEAEAYKTKRLQEELAQFKRKAERMKKIEMAGSTIDEVVLEEIREYKETLTCPSCKVKRKDAVLSKCFHVFCYDCLRTRYETRQRKCPKCNCAFGANDYHRLYLT
ncbi:PREDICTED: E3 ubiquitin-protein ligase Bre1-like [Rhagoletis zephyria]|uniref:E3 ubiquitin-protein ligase Bre1-like n=1 Tax=Rhagoletis zephyria TaxID=28612 RepID=UPI0008118692|nr:PREDICTED: E3 ubiquitin-protein ligase Bre1-like [Rhagoletis zephyria]XP_017482291.1 PREDICTED: E3 ubiquitin-protein ligase Bre1-like [Rhagoletis zephyria]XP_017487788.1 PREDICTED: E3 ubiquitin-protein ligase Bre1-like [Rhagoletis zephyria]XP_017487789.1 PREDICTED: E3 ubiquitin-protein ligase Bre1-like [Rhagoletis zephyria]